MEPRTTPADLGPESYTERVRRVLIHIQRHLDDDLALEELAEIAHFSAFHFHRIFRGMVGESLMAHVRRLRLERAAYQLKYTDRPLVDVALDAAYETQESFTRAFSAAFGQPPGRFRREERPLPRAHSSSNAHYEPNTDLEGFTPPARAGEPMRVETRTRARELAVSLRHVGPYDGVTDTWDELATWAGGNGLVDRNSIFFGLCHDDPDITPADKLRYDACITVAQTADVEPPFTRIELPAGDYAMTVHEGAYERLSGTYLALFGDWFPGSGREPRGGPCMEIYLNDPNVTEPEDLLTELWIPLTPVGRHAR